MASLDDLLNVGTLLNRNLQQLSTTFAQTTTAANGTIRSNISGATAVPADNTLSAVLDAIIGSSVGLTLMRQSGGWAGVTSATKFWFNTADYGAVADCLFISDAAMASGSAVLTSASNPFTTAAVVGKTICVEGAGAAGATLVSTIASRQGNGQVTLASANASGGAISGKRAHYGTDNTTAINNAIAAASAAGGGTVVTTAGYYLIRNIDLTHTGAIRFMGIAPSVNNFTQIQIGTVFVPAINSNPILDTTGSVGIALEYFQLGSTLAAPIGHTGIVFQPSSTRASDGMSMRHVFVTGTWGLAPWVACVVPGRMWNCYFWNYGGGVSQFAAVMSRDVLTGSAFQTPGTGTGNPLWACYECEFHEYNGAATVAAAVYLRGILRASFYGCLIDSSSTTYGSILAERNNATDCSVILINSTLYSEHPSTPPLYSIYSATPCTLYGLANSYAYSSARTGGGGAFTWGVLDS